MADGAGSGSWLNLQGAATVIVNTISDLPAAAAGVIQLDDNIKYIFQGAISTADRFALGANNSLTSLNMQGPAVTYTGTGVMWTGVDVDLYVDAIRLAAPNGTFWSLSDTVGGVREVYMNAVRYDSGGTFGTFDNLSVLNMRNSGGFCQQGMTIVGADWNALGLIRVRIVSTSASCIGVDLGTAVCKIYDIESLIVDAPAGGIGINGAASSANVFTGSIGLILNSLFIGGLTTPLVGLTTDDVRWNYQGNSANVPNTQPDSMLSIVSNATPTVVSVGVPTLVLGTWTDERSSHFTNTAAGRAAYVGERDLTTPIDVSITLDVASGTNKSIRCYIAKNGTVITNSGKAVLVSSGTPVEVTLQWQDALAENDYVEIYIENEGDSVNPTVIDGILRVR